MVGLGVFSAVAGVVHNGGATDFNAEEGRLLRFGRVVDTGRLHAEFGYQPHWTTAEAIDSCMSGGPSVGRVTSAAVRVGSEALAAWRSAQRRKRVAATGA